MINFKTRLNKTTGEIRFRPTLTSWDRTVELAKSIEKEFEHWRISSKSDVTLYNIESKSLIKIKFDSILFLNEGEQGATDELIENVKNIFTKLVEGSDVKEFRHIGCRKQFVIETDFNYSDLADLTFKKFYSSQEFLKEASVTDKVMDTLFVLDGKKNGLRNHVQIGPTLKEQALQSFAPSFEHKELEEKSFLFFDIDVFKVDDITKENAIKTFTETIKNNIEITESYMKYVIEQ